MKENYVSNIEDYLEEEVIGEYKAEINDDFGYVPQEEMEASFAFVESIKANEKGYELTLRVENEFTNEKYIKKYSVQKGVQLELNAFKTSIMCYMPPEKVPVLSEVVDVSENHITMKIIGIRKDYML